jgi:hypothetical protein
MLSLFFDLNMEAICSSETSVDTERTKRRYIPEDGTLYTNRVDKVRGISLHTFIMVDLRARHYLTNVYQHS